MRFSFWIWLALWIVTWACAILVEVNASPGLITYLIGMSALFFVCFFLTSIAAKSQPVLWVFIISIITVSFLLPLNNEINPFTWMMLGLVLAVTINQSAGHKLYGLVSLILLSAILLHIEYVSPMIASFFFVLSVSVLTGTYYYQYKLVSNRGMKDRYQALLQTYRKHKRDTVTNDQHARQQERIMIGREIHDRVGHTLTNLLMQIEILRLQDNRAEWDLLKNLANESLSESRKAVKALKEDHVTGIAAVIHLIRKLEAEQYVSIAFLTRQNALSVSLSPKQATVVYRAIQESLTNVMRHSRGKEATIILEAPGTTHFRFEVINPVEDDIEYREGFGLKSMKERLAQIDGELDVLVYNNQFIVRGLFPIEGERVE
ncbi:sensor histidine kinase [Gracilibacillus kekensis]|uniref:histidine kinase n=1 Tax=Gracilibacillus kekensis TaxID=1027249 RepID=A0A1M7L1L8_9BACI|nr:histidine kinase [Gracilibacillus kekensis]SHM71741.1 Signal transduction histidine kinase [Gracilibacillus kekensis]